MKKRISRSLVLIVLIFSLAGCLSPSQTKCRDSLFQVSTIDALMAGIYDGQVSFAQLQKHGDFGIGTFDALDGEMAELDGRFYQIKNDGKAYPVSGSMKTPFAMVTYFNADKQILINKAMGDKQLEQYISSFFLSPNIFYAIRIDGEFVYLKARSVPAQAKPYPGLSEVVKNQSTFEFHNTKGSLIGFYVPVYFKGLNVAGYHFHFLTQDRTAGGHVLSFKVRNAMVSLSYAHKFSLFLPDNKEFYALDLSKDKESEVNKAEK